MRQTGAFTCQVNQLKLSLLNLLAPRNKNVRKRTQIKRDFDKSIVFFLLVNAKEVLVYGALHQG